MLPLFSGTYVSNRGDDNEDDNDVDNDDERFTTVRPHCRLLVGEMERAACMRKSKPLRPSRMPRKKCRGRFPVDPGTLMDPLLKFSGQDPKPWRVAAHRDVVHL